MPLSRPAQAVTVGIGEFQVSADPGVSLITYALGSCIGISVWDPVVRAGGLLHAMLPKADRKKLDSVSLTTYVDTGVAQLFRACYELGVTKERAIIKAAGGAARRDADEDMFQIGQRNITMLRKVLWKNGVMLQAEDLGGTVYRTMGLDISSGRVLLKTPNGESEL